MQIRQIYIYYLKKIFIENVGGQFMRIREFIRIVKFTCLLALVFGLIGCSCRTRKVGPGDDNISMADESSVEALSDIYFAFDSYQIPASGKEKASRAAAWLEANPGVSVTLEGHCDERGTTEYNMVLGANRAQAVFTYLQSLGVAPGRMGTVSYGEELPIDPGHNEAAWARNRRVHFDVREQS